MITRTFQFAVLIAVFAYFLIILALLKKRRLNLRYTLLWLLSGGVMLVLAIFPSVLDVFSEVVGVYSPTNALFAIISLFLIMILISMTVIASNLNESIKRLIQYAAILEKRVRELEQKQDQGGKEL